MIGSDFEQFLTVRDYLVPVGMELGLGDKFGEHIQLENGSMHRDNVMVELCVHPANTVQDFVDNCMAVTRQAESFLRTERGLDDVRLQPIPVARFRPEELDNDCAREIGCDVDYLADGAASIERPRIVSDALANIRCAGGHIHISYGCTEKVPEAIAAGFCDIALGALELQMGSQHQRRGFYGLAGLHRKKVYGTVAGVEYRTVSNIWLRNRRFAEVMGNNALALERLFNECSDERISDSWKQLIKEGDIASILRLERKTAGSAFLHRLHGMFPKLGFATGV